MDRFSVRLPSPVPVEAIYRRYSQRTSARVDPDAFTRWLPERRLLAQRSRSGIHRFSDDTCRSIVGFCRGRKAMPVTLMFQVTSKVIVGGER